LLARLDELLLEHGDLAGGVRQTPAEESYFLLEELHLGPQLVDLLLVALDLVAHDRHLLPEGASVARHTDTVREVA
jgi:hypothetical protein